MSTGNFYNVNTKYIYAVIPEDDCEYKFVEEELKEKLDALREDLQADEGREIARTGNRNYPEKCVGRIELQKYIRDIDLRIEINVLLRSAYYEGANLDYNYRFCIDNEEYECISDACEEFIYKYVNAYKNEGMAKIQSKNAEKWLEKTLDKVTDKIEDIFKETCTHVLEVSSVFSNGETWYSEVKQEEYENI